MSEQQQAPEETGTLLNTPPPGEGETIQTAEGEWLLTSEVKGIGEAPEWFKGEKYKTVQAQAEAYNALESKFGAFTGAPDDYELNVPEGIEVEFDDDRLSSIKSDLKEMGMNQEGFDKLLAWHLGEIAGNPEADEAAQQQEIQQVLGENHAQIISQVSGALSNMLDADTYAEISPYVNTPGAVRAIQAVILATAPKVPPIDGGNNPEGYTKAKLNSMRNERIAEGPMKGELRWHKDSAFRKQVEEYSAALHGES